MNTPTFSKIARTYPKSFDPNPEVTHNAYERFQMERYGNALPNSDAEPEEIEEENEFSLSDFQNDSNY